MKSSLKKTPPANMGTLALCHPDIIILSLVPSLVVLEVSLASPSDSDMPQDMANIRSRKSLDKDSHP